MWFEFSFPLLQMENLVFISYKCGTNLILEFSFPLLQMVNLVFISYNCGTNLIPIWYQYGSDVVPIWYQCGTDVVRMWYRSGSGFYFILPPKSSSFMLFKSTLKFNKLCLSTYHTIYIKRQNIIKPNLIVRGEGWSKLWLVSGEYNYMISIWKSRKICYSNIKFSFLIFVLALCLHMFVHHSICLFE